GYRTPQRHRSRATVVCGVRYAAWQGDIASALRVPLASAAEVQGRVTIDWPARQRRGACVLTHACALYLALVLPLLKDAPDLLIGLIQGVLWRELARGGLGKHRRDHPGTKNFVDSGIGIARVTYVRRPLQAVL